MLQINTRRLTFSHIGRICKSSIQRCKLIILFSPDPASPDRNKSVNNLLLEAHPRNKLSHLNAKLVAEEGTFICKTISSSMKRQSTRFHNNML